MGKTERLLVVPNAPRVPVGIVELFCPEVRPRVKLVRHTLVTKKMWVVVDRRLPRP